MNGLPKYYELENYFEGPENGYYFSDSEDDYSNGGYSDSASFYTSQSNSSVESNSSASSSDSDENEMRDPNFYDFA